MKIIHQSLAGLLPELRGRKVDQVRVAPLIKSFPDPSGLPRYASWVVVSAALDWERWVEWRLLVGRARAGGTDEGARAPPPPRPAGQKALARGEGRGRGGGLPRGRGAPRPRRRRGGRRPRVG